MITNYDIALEKIAQLRLDLIKSYIEWFGYDMGLNDAEINYCNYLANDPIVFSIPNLFDFETSDLIKDITGGSGAIQLTGTLYSGDNSILDQYIDYYSNDPFKNLPGPPPESKIKTYWNNGSVKSKGRLGLTWGVYVKASMMSIGSNMKRLTFNGKNDDTFSGRGNGLNNPINLLFGNVARLYNSVSSKKMADGQNNAIFSNMYDGLAASMHYTIIQYHGKNLCQLNNQQQGFAQNDGVPPPQGMGDKLGMAALRLRWVTDNMNKLGIGPVDQLDLHDRDTLYSLVSSMASAENGLSFGRKFLDKSYEKVQKHI